MAMKYHEMLSNDAPKIPKKPSPSLAELIKAPGMQVALRLAENPNRCPIHCAQSFHQNQVAANKDRKQTQNEVPLSRVFPSKRLPGECLRSWNSKLDRTILFSTHPNSHGLNWLKLAPLLSLQIQSYAVRFTACHLFDANLRCIQAAKCLVLQFISKFICKFYPLVN